MTVSPWEERVDAQPTAAQLIHALGPRPHPEGGFFAETWRAAEAIEASGLPDRAALVAAYPARAAAIRGLSRD